MHQAAAYPLLFEPVYKDYLWGGQELARRYGRTGTGDICAESWEISDRTDGMSVISNGPLRGTSLADLGTKLGERLLGSESADGPFPLLIKLIDAKQDLSVQVHPNNASAPITNGQPKTEMWYVLAAQENARIFAGLRPGVTEDRFLDALDRHVLSSEALADVAAVPGQALFIPGGRVHAIGAGCLLLEVQQNSNTTYRVYDWDRRDQEGNSRPLHLDQALAVIDWDDAEPTLIDAPPHETSDAQTDILSCPYFSIRHWRAREAVGVENDGRSFHAWFCADGTCTIRTAGGEATLLPGTSCLMPAEISTYEIIAACGGVELLQISAVSSF